MDLKCTLLVLKPTFFICIFVNFCLNDWTCVQFAIHGRFWFFADDLISDRSFRLWFESVQEVDSLSNFVRCGRQLGHCIVPYKRDGGQTNGKPSISKCCEIMIRPIACAEKRTSSFSDARVESKQEGRRWRVQHAGRISNNNNAQRRNVSNGQFCFYTVLLRFRSRMRVAKQTNSLFIRTKRSPLDSRRLSATDAQWSKMQF